MDAESSKVPRYVSYKADPFAYLTGVLSVQREVCKCYLFPLFVLLVAFYKRYVDIKQR